MLSRFCESMGVRSPENMLSQRRESMAPRLPLDTGAAAPHAGVMRVLVINSNRERAPWPVPPMGACAVASSARAAGHEVRFLDLCFVRDPARAVRQAAAEFRPEVLAVTIRNIDNCDWQASRPFLPAIRARIVAPARAAAPCPVVLGGPAVSLMPREFLEFFQADYAIAGDGEAAFVDLLAALAAGKPVDAIEGLAWRDAGGVHRNPPSRIADVGRLPLPEPQRWIDLAQYASYGGFPGVQTKRGCALTCTYCAYNLVEGSCYRLKPPERVGDEVAALVGAGARHVEFVDSTFNVPLDHALDVCRMLARRRFPAEFSTMGINPQAVTEELFRRMAEAGFSELAMTPETAAPEMLEALGKGFTVEELERAVAVVRRSRLPFTWYFLFGGPGETADTVRRTLEFIRSHIPGDHLVVMVSGIRIIPGSPLERRAREEGMLAPGQDLLKPAFYRPPIGREELFRLLDEAGARHPNYFVLRDEHVPRALLRAASAAKRFLRLRRPMWHYAVAYRRLAAALGLR